MQYRLNTTSVMAASTFNSMVLSVMEKDALNTALMRLQSASKAMAFTGADVVREANSILPQAKDGEAIRLFFSTRHQTQDNAFDNTQDLAIFVMDRARHIGLMMERQPLEAKFKMMRDDLAEGYSYVIESVHNLLGSSMVASRRLSEAQALLGASGAAMAPFEAQLLEDASAFYTARLHEDDASGDDAHRLA